ncbi:MAG: hypothetical protein ABXS93_05350 [Sulfurimonas sp.]
MFTKFKSTNSVVFLDPHAEKPLANKEGEKIDLILSPSLYWVKCVALPVKYVRDAKKLVASIFEEQLPEGSYSYAVFKEGEEFLLFAYEDQKIIEEIHKKNISISNVDRVYFAQTELADALPCMINENEALAFDEGIVFVTPSSWFDSLEKLSLSELKLSKNSIKLQQFSHIIDNSSLYKVGALLGVFIVLLLVEIFITAQKIDAVEVEKGKLFDEYKLYPTMMQNKAVLREYKTTFTQQEKLRDLIETFLKLPLKNTQKIERIRYKQKTLYVDISGVKKGELKQIQRKLTNYKKGLKSTFKENLLQLEVAL